MAELGGPAAPVGAEVGARLDEALRGSRDREREEDRMPCRSKVHKTSVLWTILLFAGVLPIATHSDIAVSTSSVC